MLTMHQVKQLRETSIQLLLFGDDLLNVAKHRTPLSRLRQPQNATLVDPRNENP